MMHTRTWLVALISALLFTGMGCAALDPYPEDEFASTVAPPVIVQVNMRSRLVLGALHGDRAGRSLFFTACGNRGRIPFTRERRVRGDFGVTFGIVRHDPDLGALPMESSEHHGLHDMRGSTVVLLYESFGRARTIAEALTRDLRFVNLAPGRQPVDQATIFVTIANSAHPAFVFMAKERPNALEGVVALVHDEKQAAHFLGMRMGSAHLPEKSSR